MIDRRTKQWFYAQIQWFTERFKDGMAAGIPLFVVIGLGVGCLRFWLWFWGF